MTEAQCEDIDDMAECVLATKTNKTGVCVCHYDHGREGETHRQR